MKFSHNGGQLSSSTSLVNKENVIFLITAAVCNLNLFPISLFIVLNLQDTLITLSTQNVPRNQQRCPWRVVPALPWLTRDLISVSCSSCFLIKEHFQLIESYAQWGVLPKSSTKSFTRRKQQEKWCFPYVWVPVAFTGGSDDVWERLVLFARQVPALGLNSSVRNIRLSAWRCVGIPLQAWRLARCWVCLKARTLTYNFSISHIQTGRGRNALFSRVHLRRPLCLCVSLLLYGAEDGGKDRWRTNEQMYPLH